MKVLSYLLAMMSPLLVDAQDIALAKKYEEKVVFTYGSSYMLDGQRLPKSGLSVLLNKYNDSRSEFQSAKKWSSIGMVINLASAIIPIYGLYQYKNSNKDFKPYLIASFATAYISFPILSKGRKHLHKSIWLYNKNALIN
jgi:hypothetical protein